MRKLALGLVIITLYSAFSWAGSKEKVLHSFNGKDGNWPTASVIFDSSGNLYGTTFMGGANVCGTVFELVPQANGKWDEKLLHSFNGADGCYPNAGQLLIDSAGNLYGTAEGGGTYSNGVVFELSPHSDGTWQENVLYNFCQASNCVDGAWPFANLLMDVLGNLYGLTVYGGANSSECDGFGCGTVFQLTPTGSGMWAEAVLYSFCSMTGCADGAEPWTGLTSDAAGNLYGMTNEGGIYNCELGCGTVFELVAGSNGIWTEKTLYNFCSAQGCTDGARPWGTLAWDVNGNLYGITSDGGTRARRGTVFRLTGGQGGAWTEKVLHRFQLHNRPHDGVDPESGLLVDAAGNVYGTTRAGGIYGYGTVFKVQTKGNDRWHEVVLYSFNNKRKKGFDPNAAVISDAAGHLYDTTSEGGAHTCGAQPCGTVFELTP